MSVYFWQVRVFCLTLVAHFLRLVSCREDFAVFCGSGLNIHVGAINSGTFTRIPLSTSATRVTDVNYDPVYDKIYWIETKYTWTGTGDDRMCTPSSSIGRCDYDGGNQEYLIQGITTKTEAFCGADPRIELDIKSRLIYWISQLPGSFEELSRATTNGREIEIIALKHNEQGWGGISLHKDTQDLYWAVYSPGDIYKVNVDGTIENIISGEWGISAVAVDNTDRLFWTTYAPFAGIQAADLEGQNRTILYQSPDEKQFWSPNDIVLYRDDIYFIQAEADKGRNLYRMRKDGSEIPAEHQTGFTVECIHIHEDTVSPQTEKTTLLPRRTTLLPRRTTLLPRRSTPSSLSAAVSIGTLEIAIIAVSIFIIVVIIIGVTVLVSLKRCSDHNEEPALRELNRHISNEYNSKPPKETDYQSNPVRPIFAEYEIVRKMLEMGDVLGSGAFGVVHKAYILNRKGKTLVAVKGLKDNATAAMKENFLDEIQLIIEIGLHSNILSILGCITNSEPYYLITEFMKYGDLLTFLRKCKKMKKEDNVQMDPIYDLNEKKQLQIARQIARGMEHLSTTRYYHGDLAARNILVGEDLAVKISDFGMADDIYTEGYKRMAPEKKRPLKWVSLETNLEGRCSIMSDVWSYGIVLYEIVTLGDAPYPGMNAQEVLRKLKSGYRMEKPRNCSDDLYKAMRECWQEDPEKRPAFKDLVSTIDTILSGTSAYLDMVDMDTEGEIAVHMDSSKGNAHYEHAISNVP